MNNVFEKSSKSIRTFLVGVLAAVITIILSDFIFNKFKTVDWNEITLIVTLLSLTIPGYFIARWMVYKKNLVSSNTNRSIVCKYTFITVSIILIVSVGAVMM